MVLVHYPPTKSGFNRLCCTVSSMNSSGMRSSAALLASVSLLVVTLAACGSDTETSPTSTPAVAELVTSSFAETPAAAISCPTAAPQSGGTPEWTLSGTTGSVAVTGSTDAPAPSVTVEAPFSVSDTQVHTLQAGDGPVVADNARVSVCYMGVNGRNGSVFDNSYQRGAPVEFPLGGVVAGFRKAIAGQTVGSTVGVAMTPADGYPQGQPGAGIEPGDSLVFAIKILSASN